MSYYTLIWKDINNNMMVNFKTFTNFEKLKTYVKEYIKGGLLKNTQSIDAEKTVYYCEIEVNME